MQQQTRRLIILVGGASITAIGLTLAACSTDNGSSPLPGQGDSGRGGTKDTGTTPDDDSSVAEKDADPTTADCGSAPKLRSNTNGFYCSFFKRDGGAGDAGSASNCANDETCCSPGKNSDGTFPATFCATASEKGGSEGQTVCAAQASAHDSAWNATGSSTWECADSVGCGTGKVCCLFTAPDAGGVVNIGNSTDKSIPKECKAQQAYKQGGTRCADSCTADEIKLCSKTDDNCSGSAKCTPFQALFRDLSYCK